MDDQTRTVGVELLQTRLFTAVGVDLGNIDRLVSAHIADHHDSMVGADLALLEVINGRCGGYASWERYPEYWRSTQHLPETTML